MSTVPREKKPRFTLRPEVLLNSLRLRRSVLDTYGQKNLYKFIIGFNLFLISIGSLFYTNDLVSKLEEREIRQMKLYAEGLRYALTSDFNEDLTGIMQIIREANSFYEIPAIYVDDNNMPADKINISFPENASPETKERILNEQLSQMKKEHEPIPVEMGEGRVGYIYYSNSFLLTQLRYYPYIQLSGIFIIGFLAYLSFSAARRAEQNRVWVGLAKETAHQLGTPLSSLMAWIEYFRADPDFDPSIADELEKDVQRLEMITTRFSNIGSVPTLKDEDVAAIITEFITYLRKRVSTKVHFFIDNQLPEGHKVLLNRNLFEWVIENVCKNAVDAMAGVGEIRISLVPKQQGEIVIDISDTGKGISKANLQKVFNPGFSTKKRGWGLGLTLAKRIIENYHAGKLFVKSSEPGKGTTFRIIMQSTPAPPK
ncbi:HAMP domain-containing sensor histidine kinase [Rhabdobacter roseus]|uniref:histidine kinase n=1 Tax=Rhabdobacter roseus TaxID=1655419 RepID=A0A840TL99_9BACT|nr:HAMP domain-containing sensor histidine kinase [Rhabdobacter roseus]MBB5284194.1 anti-sigma regulatory factor (Ser/Thr protein kinase) [Rhabdobacter roseus]